MNKQASGSFVGNTTPAFGGSGGGSQPHTSPVSTPTSGPSTSPTPPHITTPRPPQTTPVGQPQYGNQQNQQNQGGFGGMFNFRSPQGFASMAGMFRPVTEAVANYGGLPAIMGLYGAMSGNSDWRNTMTRNPYDVGTSLGVKTSRLRLPLPVAGLGSLRPPTITKKANGWNTPTTMGLAGAGIGAGLGAGYAALSGDDDEPETPGQPKKKKNFLGPMVGGALLGGGLGLGAHYLTGGQTPGGPPGGGPPGGGPPGGGPPGGGPPGDAQAVNPRSPFAAAFRPNGEFNPHHPPLMDPDNPSRRMQDPGPLGGNASYATISDYIRNHDIESRGLDDVAARRIGTAHSVSGLAPLGTYAGLPLARGALNPRGYMNWAGIHPTGRTGAWLRGASGNSGYMARLGNLLGGTNTAAGQTLGWMGHYPTPGTAAPARGLLGLRPGSPGYLTPASALIDVAGVGNTLLNDPRDGGGPLSDRLRRLADPNSHGATSTHNAGIAGSRDTYEAMSNLHRRPFSGALHLAGSVFNPATNLRNSVSTLTDTAQVLMGDDPGIRAARNSEMTTAQRQNAALQHQTAGVNAATPSAPPITIDPGGAQLTGSAWRTWANNEYNRLNREYAAAAATNPARAQQIMELRRSLLSQINANSLRPSDNSFGGLWYRALFGG